MISDGLNEKTNVGDVIGERNSRGDIIKCGRVCQIKNEAHPADFMRHPEVKEWRTIYTDTDYDRNPRYIGGASIYTIGKIGAQWYYFSVWGKEAILLPDATLILKCIDCGAEFEMDAQVVAYCLACAPDNTWQRCDACEVAADYAAEAASEIDYSEYDQLAAGVGVYHKLQASVPTHPIECQCNVCTYDVRHGSEY